MRRLAEKLYMKFIERIAFNSFIAGKYQKAEYYFLKMHAIAPQKPLLNYNLGLTYMSMGYYQDAERFFNNELAAQGEFYEINRSMADMYYTMGNREKSLERYRRALDGAQDEKSIKFIKKRVEKCRDKKEFERSRQAFELFDEGNKLLEQKDFEAAEEKYKESIRLDGTNAMALNNLGAIYMNYIIKFDEAEKCFKQAFDLVDIPITRLNYQKILKQQKRRGGGS